jgi:hypothetical protein
MPEILVDDMTKRGVDGPDRKSGTEVETPDRLTVYTAGFVCVDSSSENVSHRKPLQERVTEDSGESTKTAVAAFEYIRKFRPARFLFENPYKRQTVEVLRALAADLPNFLLVLLVVNSRATGAKTSRPRMYAVGINLQERVVSLPVQRWKDELRNIFKHMREKAPPLQAYLLPNSSDSVQECLTKLRAKHLRAKHRCLEGTWERERAKHMGIRQAFKDMFQLELPPPERRPKLPDDSCGTCLELLPLRMRDVVYLHTAAAWYLLGVSPAEHSLSWDISHSVTYSRKKSPACAGLVPCLTRTHYVWCAEAHRVYCGLEHLALQGFDTGKIALSGVPGGMVDEIHLSDDELRHLAGSTMTVPVVTAMFGFVKVLTPPVEEWVYCQEATEMEGHGEAFFLDESWAGHFLSRTQGNSNTTCVDVLPDFCGNLAGPDDPASCEEASHSKRLRRVREKSRVGPVQAQWPLSPTTIPPALMPHQAHVAKHLHPGPPCQRMLIDYPTGSGKTRTMI